MSAQRPSPRWQRAIGFVALSLLALVGVAKAAGFRLNLTSSVPCGLWREVPFEAEKGRYALLCPPNEPWLRVMVDAGQLPTGYCDSGSTPFIKRIAGVGGDDVAIDERGVFVNGVKERQSQPIRPGWVQPFSGRLDDTQVVYVNTLLVSLDSRYFGAVDTDRVIAGVEPVWASSTYCR